MKKKDEIETPPDDVMEEVMEDSEEFALDYEEEMPEEEPVVEEPVVEEPVIEEPVKAQAEIEREAVLKSIEEQKAIIAQQRARGKDDDEISKKKAAEFAERKAALEAKAKEMYTEGTWAGHVNYECKACPFSTLDEALIKQHVTKHM